MKKSVLHATVLALLLTILTACGSGASIASAPPVQTEAAPQAAETLDPAQIEKLVVAEAPDKVVYYPGEQMDDTGVRINAVLKDGTVMENVEYTADLEIVSENTKELVFHFGGLSVSQSLTVLRAGNAPQYSVASTPADESSLLKGKHLFFLGSSVTYGASSEQESIPEFMDKVYGTVSIKEAVSGTTLAEAGDSSSYVERFDAFLASEDCPDTMDCVIIQLSTNDDSKKAQFGQVAPDYLTLPEFFDTHTTFGAMEYLITRVKDTWDCPIVFYSNPPTGSDRYALLVDGLDQIAAKWGITVVDLYRQESLQSLTPEEQALYMADSIHPTKAGYRDLWLPEFYTGICTALGL